MAFDGFQHQTQFLNVDNELVNKIVSKLKSQGIFDQFRKDCLADVDTKPAYQHLQQRVNGSVSVFLKSKKWKPDLNKTQLRESLRHHVQQGFLQAGVDRIVDQVVNSKIYSVFMPKVEDMVYDTLGIEKPKKVERVKGTSLAPKTEEVPIEVAKPPEEDVSPPGESPKRPEEPPKPVVEPPKPVVESPKIIEEPPKATTPIPGISTEMHISEDEADKDDSNTIDETPFLLASLKNKDNDSNSKVSEISCHTIHEISSTTESLQPKTPIKTNTPKLDNFSNLSEKLKQFDPLAQPVKKDEKPDIKNYPEDDTSSSMQIDESNGFNDSNVEFDRLLSEDSKSSMSDFNKKYKPKDKINDSNDSNIENKKKDIKKTESKSSSKDRSRRDSDRKDSKSHSRSSKHKDSSRDKDKKDDRKSSKDEKHRKSTSHKHKSDSDTKKKEDDKRESRKRKNERCSDSKSKEPRRSSDRDNSGSGHSSRKSSRSEHKSSSKSSSSKSKEPEQKNSQDVQDSEGLNEVDLILMKINSSIEEEMALEPKKTKYAKNIHEAKKINAKKNQEKHKNDDIVNNKENLTENNIFLTNNIDTQKTYTEKEFAPVNFITDFNKPNNFIEKNQEIVENNQEIVENNQEIIENSSELKKEILQECQSEDEDFLGFDAETIQKAIVQLQAIKDNWNRAPSDDKMNNNLDKSRKRPNIEPIPVESKKPKETDFDMDAKDDIVDNDESPSLTEAMLNNLLKETSIVQIHNDDDSDTSDEFVEELINSPIIIQPLKEEKPEKKTSARNEKRRRSNRAASRYSAQRYDSTDLYKPRVVISQSSRRSKALDNSIDTLNSEVLDERKTLR